MEVINAFLDNSKRSLLIVISFEVCNRRFSCVNLSNLFGVMAFYEIIFFADHKQARYFAVRYLW